MTDDPSAAEQQLVNAYERLTDAALRLDERAVNEALDELMGPLSPEDASDLGFALTEDFLYEPAPAEDIDPEYLDAVRTLLLDVIQRLGRRHPSEAYLLAFLTAAEDASSDGDAPAVEEWTTLAARVAKDADNRAEAHALRAIARSDLDRPAEALADARLADAGATSLSTRLLARWALLTLLCDEKAPEATPLALDTVAWCPPDPEQAWVPEVRQAIQRAVINEESRRESAGTRPHQASSGIFRRALTDPSWIPDPLTVGYMAAITAWVEFRGDDLTKLEETLALIGDEPLDADTAARVAMLRVVLPVGKADLVAIERELRRAAIDVQASTNPEVHAAFASLRELVHSTARGGSMLTAAETLDPRTPNGEAMRILAELHASADATIRSGEAVPPDLVARINGWLASPHEPVDLDTQAMMWVLGAMASASTRKYPEAADRLDRARAARSRLPAFAAQRTLLTSMIDDMAAALLLHEDTAAGESALEQLLAQQLADRRPALAFITATQLAVQHLRSGQFAESVRRGVTALEILAEYRESLPGSSERGSIRAAQEGVYVTVLKAAASLPDPRVLAELLEYLRAQDMPVVQHDLALTDLPLAALLPGPGTRAVDPSAVVDAVTVGRPAPVRMPWGNLALEGMVRPASSTPVPLVVPRLPDAEEHAT